VSSSSISLRNATRQDAELIADLSRETFYETFAPDNKPEDMQLFLDRQFTRGRLMLEVGRPDMEFILAYTGGEVAGYVKLRRGKAPDALGPVRALEIARLYVRQRCIGQKVGAALMAESLRRAREAGFEKVWLGVWEKNARAISFYEQWGFQRFGACDFLLGNDLQQDWLMSREA